MTFRNIMDIRKFKFTIKGTGAGGATYTCEGEVESPVADLFHAINMAMRETFMQLTQGKAQYGDPGKGCAGPYEITSFLLEKKVDA